MDFDSITQTYEQAIFYNRALNKYKGMSGDVYCDMCNRCPIQQSYATQDNDVCVKCYKRIADNVKIWIYHINNGRKELDDILKLCIEKGCILNLVNKEINVLSDNADNQHLANEYKSLKKKLPIKQQMPQNCMGDPKICPCPNCKTVKDNDVDMWYRPRYDKGIDNPLAMGENTRLHQDKEDDMKDDGHDEELADYKDHMDTRRTRFVPDDTFA